jgi:SAM-dependent methyltransferase
MALRKIAKDWAGGRLSRSMAQLNARHPWSHNDHFHSWILSNLPAQRRTALDVGCGRGDLLAALSPHFAEVLGTDVDDAMRRQSADRCAGLPNVSVTDDQLSDVRGELDLVTMVAVLHHLDVSAALLDVRRLLAPGGRFLAVGLAPPRSPRDHAWDLASMVTNPVIGYVKHPWPSRGSEQSPPYPVREPTMPFDSVRDLVREVMPGGSVRHHLGFRHTIAWTKDR